MQGTLRRLAAVAALVVPFSAAARELDADALARALDNLQSNAQEARLFIQALHGSQLTGPYARVHREELSRQVRDSARPLDGTASPPLAQKAERAKSLARKLGEALDALDAAAIEAAQRDLAKLAQGT
jgi:hypothetical protein